MGFDVFNALDLMDNKDFLEKLKFGVGDGFLQYYLYNWKCPHMETNQVSQREGKGGLFSSKAGDGHSSNLALSFMLTLWCPCIVSEIVYFLLHVFV